MDRNYREYIVDRKNRVENRWKNKSYIEYREESEVYELRQGA